MLDCNKCIFSKCCKDVGSNIKKCVYYEENTTWIKEYLQQQKLWKKEYDSNIKNPSDTFLACVLKVRQKESVEIAKEELKWTAKIVGIVFLAITVMLAFHFGNTYKWSTMLLYMIAITGSSILFFLLGKGLWTFFKYIFGLIKVIVRKR